MKLLTKYIVPCFFMCLLLIWSCSKDDEPIIDNALRVLTQKINNENASNGVENIPINAEITLLLTHSLNTTAFDSALSLSGPNGAVAFSTSYSNTNSEVTIVNTEEFEYETVYTLSIAAGSYSTTGETLDNTFNLSFKTAPFVPKNVSLTQSVNTISESSGSAIITINLSEASDQDVSVNLAFSGDASKDIDYNASLETVNIPVGDLSTTIEILSIQDNEIEGTENIIVSIETVTNAIELTPQEVTISITDDDIDSNGDGFPDQGFIINEVLFDPPGGDAGDANGDGIRSASQDEFIEFINDSDQAVDLSGYTLYDASNFETLEPRHTFPAGTIIDPGGVYVLFGGGTPSGDFGVAQTAVSTSGNMNLTNSDDIIIILDNAGNEFLRFDTQVEGAGIGFGEDQSVTRFDDINGDYTLHTMADMNLLYSPGKRVDGSNFDGIIITNPEAGFIINEVLFDPPGGDAGDANGDGTRSASEDEFIEFINDTDSDVDLSGYMLFDETNLMTMEPRHIFPDGTIIPARSVYVLFGGGTPSGNFGNALVGVSSTGNMNLSNSADVITILDTNGNVFLSFNTDTDGMGLDFGSDQSITRNPDITGNFVLQQDANAGFLFTPGTKNDGTGF